MTLRDFDRLAIFWFTKIELLNRFRNGVIDEIKEVPHKFCGPYHSAHSAVLRCPRNISTVLITLETLGVSLNIDT